MASHNLEHKSPKRKRALGKELPVAKADVPALKKLLGRG
jgi:ribosomal protein L35